MRLQFGQRHHPTLRDAVAHEMQVRHLKIDHLATRRVLHIGVPDGPFLGHRPVENPRPARDGALLDIDIVFKDIDGVTHAFAGDAATDRKEAGSQIMNSLADTCLSPCIACQLCTRLHLAHPGLLFKPMLQYRRSGAARPWGGAG
ncbi:hypothetical protein D3C80_1586550 [compost metagenome]